MLRRCLVLCTLILTPCPALVALSSANVHHVGRNIVVTAEQTVESARCFLCSAEIQGKATGSVHVFAGNVFLNGSVAGNVVVFGGNLTLTNQATIGGRVLIFGGHLHQDAPQDVHQDAPQKPATDHPPSVFAPIIFLPIILAICAAVGGLILLTRRMVRGPVAYPPLPRL